MPRLLSIILLLLTGLSPLAACGGDVGGAFDVAVSAAADSPDVHGNKQSDSDHCCGGDGCGSCCPVVECACDQDSQPLPAAPVPSNTGSRSDAGKTFCALASSAVIVSADDRVLCAYNMDYAAQLSIPLFLLNRSIRT